MVLFLGLIVHFSLETSLVFFVGDLFASFTSSGHLKFSHQNMDQSTLYKTCPFCNKDYKKLGIHLTHCPDRNGRDFEHLLSQKTLDKRSGKKTKETCPKCGKKFDRLDTHLRTSATCKDTQPNRNHPENVPSSFAS